MLKLDLGKPYDKVDWSFLDAILELKGIGTDGEGGYWDVFLRKVSLSLKMVDLDVKGKDLRHGDPLSPFLFNIVEDALSRLIYCHREKRLIKTFVVGNLTIEVMHYKYTRG